MARRRRTYLLRFCYLGLMLLVLAMAWAGASGGSRYQTQSLVAQAQQRAELGHVFLTAFSLFSIAAMHLIGPVLTGSAIGVERMRRTLDALLMTPLSAWQIVCGKLFSRLLTALSLIGLTLPVLAIVRLLGGVETDDLIGSVALAAATAMGSAAIGLLLSCFMRRAFAVILLSFLIEAAIYFIIPMLLAFLIAVTGAGGRGQSMVWLQIFAACNPFWTAGFHSAGTGVLVEWWPAIAVQIGLAIFMSLLATRAVRREAQQIRPAVLTSSPPPLAGRGGGPGASLEAMASPEAEVVDARAPQPALSKRDGEALRKPVGENPVAWRETRRPMLARPWQRIVATVLTLGLLAFAYIVFGVARELADNDAQIAFAFVMTTLLLLISIVLSATAIATEKESDTWTTLIASPLSGRAIVWGKFRGVIRRMRWPMILVAGHFAIFTLAGVINIGTLAVVLWTATIFCLPWIATGLYFSLRCKRPTTAVVLNLLLPFGCYAIVPLALSTLESAVDPLHRSEFYEGVCYYLPYFYQAISIERLSSRNRGYDGMFSLPAMGTRVENWTIIPMALVAGFVLAMITAGVLALMANRFDRIVGRAKGF